MNKNRTKKHNDPYKNVDWVKQMLENQYTLLRYEKEHLLNKINHIDEQIETLKVANKQYKKLQNKAQRGD